MSTDYDIDMYAHAALVYCMLIIARVLSVDTSHLRADSNPTPGAPRPRDAHLSIVTLTSQMGVHPRFTPFEYGIRRVLKPFFPSIVIDENITSTPVAPTVPQKAT
jgi:hypothetical protein